jgi:hypothetical protein
VAYDDLRSEGGWGQPGVIRFAEPGRSFDDGVEIGIKERKLNPTMSPQAFQLAAPEGFATVNHPCPEPPP